MTPDLQRVCNEILKQHPQYTKEQIESVVKWAWNTLEENVTGYGHTSIEYPHLGRWAVNKDKVARSIGALYDRLHYNRDIISDYVYNNMYRKYIQLCKLLDKVKEEENE